MAEFTSFDQFRKYFKKTYNPTKLRNIVLEELRTYLTRAIKEMHGVKQPGWPKGTNPTPLLKSGKLKRSVRSKRVRADEALIFTKEEYLASIHEYGKTWKMTEKQRKFLFAVVFPESKGSKKKSSKPGYITIPARPIWSKVLQTEKKAIKRIVREIIEKLDS